jgi:hypothetical protein
VVVAEGGVKVCLETLLPQLHDDVVQFQAPVLIFLDVGFEHERPTSGILTLPVQLLLEEKCHLLVVLLGLYILILGVETLLGTHLVVISEEAGNDYKGGQMPISISYQWIRNMEITLSKNKETNSGIICGRRNQALITTSMRSEGLGVKFIGKGKDLIKINVITSK